MRRILFLGVAAVLATSTFVLADLGPRPGPRPVPQPQPQQTKIKVSIEVDEKATEPRLIIPMQAALGGFNFGGGFIGAAGVGGAAGMGGAVGFGGGAAAFGQVGNFGAIGGQLGQVGGPPPGQFGGALGAIGVPPGGQMGTPPVKDRPRDPRPSGAPPGGNDGEQEEASDESPAPKTERSSLKYSTIIVGLALTLSLTTGGLWLVRRKPNLGTNKYFPTLLLVAMLGATALTGAAVWANGAPRPRPPQPPRPAPQVQVPGPLPTMFKGEAFKVDIVPQGDTVRVILTKKMKEDLVKEATKAAAKDK